MNYEQRSLRIDRAWNTGPDFRPMDDDIKWLIKIAMAAKAVSDEYGSDYDDKILWNKLEDALTDDN